MRLEILVTEGDWETMGFSEGFIYGRGKGYMKSTIGEKSLFQIWEGSEGSKIGREGPRSVVPS